ncbi:MAG: T9SS type A sorting domain-containing protein [Saprospiraceae bacterium]
MKKLLIIFIFLIISFNCIGQSYTVTAFMDEYSELTSYNSIAIETQGDIWWEKRFELPFDFELFDTSYNYMICDWDGSCYFDDDVEYSIKLLTFGYEFDNVLDTINILSDVRYQFIEENGLNCLVVQFTKVRLDSDPSVDEYDSNVNFQWWYFENGDIEVRFGPSNLDYSPVYVPGEGFYYLPSNGDPILSGPEMTLTHPHDEDIFVDYGNINSYDTYEITYNEYSDGMRWWPPSGWVIRFENNYVGTDDLSKENQDVIYPNPVKDILNIREGYNFDYARIFSIEGKCIRECHSHIDKIDVSSLPSGIYYLDFKNNNETFTNKFIKI